MLANPPSQVSISATILQSMTVRCVFMQTVQPSHLNGNIRHEALKAASATPFPLSFQKCIKLPPVMTSYAIIALTTTFLSYPQLVMPHVRDKMFPILPGIGMEIGTGYEANQWLSVSHEALKAASATPFPLSFQKCIKLPPVMRSYAIIALTTTFLSYPQLVMPHVRDKMFPILPGIGMEIGTGYEANQ